MQLCGWCVTLKCGYNRKTFLPVHNSVKGLYTTDTPPHTHFLGKVDFIQESYTGAILLHTPGYLTLGWYFYKRCSIDEASSPTFMLFSSLLLAEVPSFHITFLLQTKCSPKPISLITGQISRLPFYPELPKPAPLTVAFLKQIITGPVDFELPVPVLPGAAVGSSLLLLFAPWGPAWPLLEAELGSSSLSAGQPISFSFGYLS